MTFDWLLYNPANIFSLLYGGTQEQLTVDLIEGTMGSGWDWNLNLSDFRAPTLIPKH